jgi:hypothetical protein
MSMSVFEASLFDSFEKTCKKFGFGITYADKTFQITDNGTKIFEGGTLETQHFLKNQLFSNNARRI